MERKIWVAYFSATDTTKKIVCTIGDQLAAHMMNKHVYDYDFTLKSTREKACAFDACDLVVFGVPVYAGRVPNVLLKYLNTLQGNGAVAIPIVCYGNRNYDDSLLELCDILQSTGFHTIAAGAFIGEHAFSYTLAAGRPDAADISKAIEFGDEVAEKLKHNIDFSLPIHVSGTYPYRPYYVPKNRDRQPINILKDRPKTSSICTDCKLCATICPMNSINYENVTEYTGICIKCGACVKKCPVHAKYYDSDKYLYHKEELEIEYTRRAEPEIFL